MDLLPNEFMKDLCTDIDEITKRYSYLYGMSVCGSCFCDGFQFARESDRLCDICKDIDECDVTDAFISIGTNIFYLSDILRKLRKGIHATDIELSKIYKIKSVYEISIQFYCKDCLYNVLKYKSMFRNCNNTKYHFNEDDASLLSIVYTDIQTLISKIEYYKCTDCVIIESCGGEKCRIHHRMGTGYHCAGCFGADHENEPIFDSYDPDINGRIHINCKGDKCRINDKYVRCIGCYGSDSDSEY